MSGMLFKMLLLLLNWLPLKLLLLFLLRRRCCCCRCCCLRRWPWPPPPRFITANWPALLGSWPPVSWTLLLVVTNLNLRVVERFASFLASAGRKTSTSESGSTSSICAAAALMTKDTSAHARHIWNSQTWHYRGFKYILVKMGIINQIN